jgi:putative transposase
LFNEHKEGQLLGDIRQAANKGLVLGSKRFVEELKALTGKRLKLKGGEQGWPVGWRKTDKPC